MTNRLPSRQRRTKLLLVLALLTLLFVPYPTQLSPALKLQIVDHHGKGVPGLSAKWYGGFYADYFEEKVTLDSQGCLSLPGRSVRLSLASRAGAVLESLRPHCGWRSASASVYLEIPEDYEFEGSTLGQDGVWSVYSQPVNGGPGTTRYSYVEVITNHPTHRGVSSYRLALRPNPSPTPLADRPGAALFIVLEKNVPGCNSTLSGKAVCRAIRPLDGIAEKLGVMPLTTFICMDVSQSSDLLQEALASEGVTIPPERWFDPDEGLKSVTTLHDRLRQGTDEISHKGEVITDLAELERALHKAKVAGVRWHLQVEF